MNNLKVKIQKLHESVEIPKYAHNGDAGLDLKAFEVEYDVLKDTLIYRTGLSIEIPEGYVGLIYPRSSIADKDLMLTNSVGVIDSTFRGEILVKFKLIPDYISTIFDKSCKECTDVGLDAIIDSGEFLIFNDYRDLAESNLTPLNVYKIGNKIAQLIIIPYPKVVFEEVDSLSTSERGNNGYGSTGD